MEQINLNEIENIELGQNMPPIVEDIVTIKEYRLETIEDRDKNKEIGKKLVLSVEHPQVEDKLLDISSAKYQSRDRLRITGLWWRLDKDNKVPYSSAVGYVLRHLNIKKLSQIKGLRMETVVDDNGYLALKAY